MAVIIDTPLRGISRKITPRYIGYGEVDVDFPEAWYLHDTDGNLMTDSQGRKIFSGSPTADPIHGLGGYKSPYLLDSDNQIMTDTQSDEYPFYETPLLDSAWRTKIVEGVATQLDTLGIEIQHVTIQAKFTNLGKIWIGNSFVTKEGGVYLLPNHPPVTINISDLRNIYIIGNAGEGVDFLYGTNEDLFLTTPGGEFITTPGEEPIDV